MCYFKTTRKEDVRLSPRKFYCEGQSERASTVVRLAQKSNQGKQLPVVLAPFVLEIDTWEFKRRDAEKSLARWLESLHWFVFHLDKCLSLILARAHQTFPHHLLHALLLPSGPLTFRKIVALTLVVWQDSRSQCANFCLVMNKGAQPPIFTKNIRKVLPFIMGTKGTAISIFSCTRYKDIWEDKNI